LSESNNVILNLFSTCFSVVFLFLKLVSWPAVCWTESKIVQGATFEPKSCVLLCSLETFQWHKYKSLRANLELIFTYYCIQGGGLFQFLILLILQICCKASKENF